MVDPMDMQMAGMMVEQLAALSVASMAEWKAVEKVVQKVVQMVYY